MQVLSGENTEEPVHWISSLLMQKCQEMDENKIELDNFIITKTLTKDPQDYPDAKHQAHVQVALRLKARGKVVRSGQDIPYIICKMDDAAGPKLSFAERARHPHEFQLDPSLVVDVAWYKSQQVHPLVTRILGPIDGIDPGRIAECLGMDSTRYSTAVASGNRSTNRVVELTSPDVEALLDRTARWSNFESRLEGVRCSKTNEVVSWQRLLKPEAKGFDALFRTSIGHAISTKQAQNCFVLQVRSILFEYSDGWVKISEGENHDAGLLKSRRVRRGQNMICEQTVLRELEYMEYLCSSASKPQVAEDDSRECRNAAARMQSVCTFLLQSNGYYWVDCNKVFASVFGCN